MKAALIFWNIRIIMNKGSKKREREEEWEVRYTGKALGLTSEHYYSGLQIIKPRMLCKYWVIIFICNVEIRTLALPATALLITLNQTKTIKALFKLQSRQAESKRYRGLLHLRTPGSANPHVHLVPFGMWISGLFGLPRWC